jgi:hypothetical protein
MDSMRAVCEHNKDGDWNYRPSDPCYRIDFLMDEAWRLGLDQVHWSGWPELLGLIEQNVYPKMTEQELAFVKPVMDSRLGTIHSAGRTLVATYRRVRALVWEVCRR